MVTLETENRAADAWTNALLGRHGRCHSANPRLLFSGPKGKHVSAVPYFFQGEDLSHESWRPDANWRTRSAPPVAVNESGTVPIIRHSVIRRAVLERSILSTVDSACSEINHTPPPRTFFIYSVAFLFWLEWRCCREKEAGSEVNTPLRTCLKSKLFHLQIYIILHTVYVRSFHLMSYCIFFIIHYYRKQS
jgi:hypothetical protein